MLLLLVRREVEGREGWRAEAQVARRRYNLTFVVEEIKAEKWFKKWKGKRGGQRGTRHRGP
jgi:hypothetical protein